MTITTVEQYLAAMPNPSPCPHSSKVTDPPCDDCIRTRIAVANALRAGQDPSIAAGVQPSEGASGRPMASQPEQLEANGAGVVIPGAAPAPSSPDPKLAGSFVDPFTPGMAHTEIQPSANDPVTANTEPTPPAQEAVADPIALLQAMADEQKANPPMVTEGSTTRPLAPLELSPEQVLRRQQIDAGIHPDVAPVPPVVGDRIDIAEHTVVTGAPEGMGTVVGEVEGSFPPEVLVQRDDPTEALLAAVPPPPEDVDTRAPGYTPTAWLELSLLWEQITCLADIIDFRDRLTALIEEDRAAEDDRMTAVAQPALAPQIAPEAAVREDALPGIDAPAEAESPHPAVVEALQAPEPAEVAMGQLTTHCAHGMPATDFSSTPPRSASCITCMEEGPPPALSKLKVERFQLAHLTTKCARTMCNRTIEKGEIIGFVEQVGWCCSRCTKPDLPPPAAA